MQYLLPTADARNSHDVTARLVQQRIRDVTNLTSLFEALYVYHQVKVKKNSTFCPHLCVLYGSKNKQRLFPYTELTDWFV